MKKPTQRTFQFFSIEKKTKNYYYLYLFIFFTFEKKIIPNHKISSKKSKRAIQNEVFVPFYFFFQI